MEYKITSQEVDAITQTLFELNVGAKTLQAIVNTLKSKPIEVKEEPKA
jgi:hypothetical protein